MGQSKIHLEEFVNNPKLKSYSQKNFYGSHKAGFIKHLQYSFLCLFLRINTNENNSKHILLIGNQIIFCKLMKFQTFLILTS